MPSKKIVSPSTPTIPLFGCIKPMIRVPPFGAELKTEKGNLLVYGTIIGTLGNRHPSFMEQLHRQCDDIAACPKWVMGYVCAEILTAPLLITTILHRPQGQRCWICFVIQD